jgi:tetratricopeptide (TPR) repeat protein
MARLWELGMAHFQRGNYYAARDLWSEALANARTYHDKARAWNSLGAAIYLLNGPKEALNYFDPLNRMVAAERPQDPHRAKYLCNLALMFLDLDMSESAIATARQVVQLLQEQQGRVVEPVFAITVCLIVFSRYDLQDEVLAHEEQIRSFLDTLVHHQQVLPTDLARCYHLLGRSYHYAQDDAKAFEYYLRAVQVCELPETLQELSRISLMHGRPESAIQHAAKLFGRIWDGQVRMQQKVDLADTLCLIGMLAYYANRHELFRACVEKAELYYGQMLRWRQWAAMRELPDSLPRIDISFPQGAIDWEQWQTFVEQLSLVDTIEAMFPTLYRWSELANNLTRRLAQRLVPQFADVWPVLRIAGRLAYLGLTALAATEAEARELLRDEAMREDIGHYGARVLESYPQSRHIQTLVRYCRTRLPDDLPPAIQTLAQCIGIALHFVELIEHNGWSHAQAAEHLVRHRRELYHPAVLEAFRNETVLEV